MTFLLPLIALALAGLSRFAFRDREPIAWHVDGTRILALLLTTLVGGFLLFRFGPEVDRSGLVGGLVIGIVAVLLGDVVGGRLSPFAIGVAGAAAIHLLPPNVQPNAMLVLVVSLGIASLALSSTNALAAALAGTLCVMGDHLGLRHSPTAGINFIGSELGLAIVVGALLAAWVPSKLDVLRPVVVGTVTLIAGFFASRGMDESGLLLSTGLGVAAGVIVHWLLPLGEEVDGVRIGIASIIGIGLATIAFGFAKGAGIAFSLVASGGMLLALGNQRALLALGPLVSIVFYHVLREAGTGATRALDIGQHYALLGIALGVVFPLIPSDWLKRQGAKAAGGAFLWALIVFAAAPIVIVMLGTKGAIGFVSGLGLAGLAQALRRESSLLPVALTGALSACTILCLAWLNKTDDFSRDDKVHFFTYVAGGLAVVSFLLALLSRTPSTEKEGGLA